MNERKSRPQQYKRPAPVEIPLAERPLIAVETSGRSCDSELSYQEALHNLQGAGLTNSEIGDVLSSGVVLQQEALISRLGYMFFLQRIGNCGEQEAHDLVTLQPRVLEQRFGIVHEDADYIVFNKPFDTKIDFGKVSEDGSEAAPKFPEGV